MIVSHIFLQNGETSADAELLTEYDGSHIVFFFRLQVLLFLPFLSGTCNSEQGIFE